MKKDFIVLLFVFVFMSIFYANFITAATYQFNGTVLNETGVALNGCNVNLTVRNMNGWSVVGDNSTTTNATGGFSLNFGEDSQQWVYEIVITHKNTTLGFVDYRSKSIPAFPGNMIQQALSGTTFYLTSAGTINITAINSSSNRVPFMYQVKDIRLGYPVAEGFSSYVTEADIVVPKNRNYSIMIYPNLSMPVSFNWNNFSASSSYTVGAGSLGTNISFYNVTTNTLTKQFNTSMTLARMTGYVNKTAFSQWTNFTIIPFLMEPGSMVHSVYGAMPYNMSSWIANNQNDDFNLTSGYFNITLPATAETSNILLFASVVNGSQYYGAVMNVSLSYGLAAINLNLTAYGLSGTNSAFISMNRGDAGGQTINIPIKKQEFYILNATNSTMANISGHIEVTVDYSTPEFNATQFTWMFEVSQSQNFANFSIPLLNATGVKEMSVFVSGGGSDQGQFAPKKTSFTNAQIKAWPNVSVAYFNPKSIDTNLATSLISVEFYYSNSSCDVPSPPSSCSIGSSATMATFNPIRSVMGGGKISFRMSYGNISIHYVNVDLLASGPPDALFSSAPNSSVSVAGGNSFTSAMKFGSSGPTIYDYVLVSIPYYETPGSGLNDSQQVNLSIPLLYDEDWNVIWNVTANGTSQNALGANFSQYNTFKSDWGNLTSPSICTTSAITNALSINSTSPCYIDSTNNKVWVRVPHFSGTGPDLDGTLNGDTTPPNVASISPGNKSFVKNPVVFSCNITDAGGIANLTLYIFNSSHYPINISSTTLSGTSNSTSWSLSLAPDNYYNWSCLGYDSAGNGNISLSGNFTFLLDNVNPNLTVIFPTNYKNISNSTIPINVTIQDNNAVNFTNISIYNSSLAVVNSTVNVSIQQYNTTLTVVNDGSYTLDFTTKDNATNTNFTSLNITVDTTPPIIVDYSPSNTTYYVNQSVWVHFTMADLTPATLWYYNGSANNTFGINGLLNMTSLNFTGPQKSNVTFYANDSFGRLSNKTVYFSIIDIPQNTTIVTDQNNFNITANTPVLALTYNTSLQNITINYTLSGDLFYLNLVNFLNPNTATVSLYNHPLKIITQGAIYNNTIEISAYTNITGPSSWNGNLTLPRINSTTSLYNAPNYGTINLILNMGLDSELNFSSPVKITLGNMAGKKAAFGTNTTGLTNIATICDSTTSPTNLNSITGPKECYVNSGNDLLIFSYHFTTFAAYTPVTTAVTPASSPSGGAAIEGYWIVTYVVTDSQLRDGYSQIFKPKYRAKFELVGGSHYVGVISSTASSVTIEVSSTSQQAVLAIGQVKKFDLNADGYYDLSVILESISSGNSAKLLITKINEKIPAVFEEGTPVQEAGPSYSPEEGETPAGLSAVPYKMMLWIGIILLVIAVAIVVVVLLRRGKKGKHSWDNLFKVY